MQKDTFKSNKAHAIATSLFCALHAINSAPMPIGQDTSTMTKSTNKVTPIGSKPAVPASQAIDAIRMVMVHTLIGGKKSPYTELTAVRSHFSAWIIAAMLVSDYITITAKGAPTKSRKKSQYGLLRGLIGATAWGHWNRIERMAHESAHTGDDGKKVAAVAEVTVAGLNAIQARLSGNGKGYNTDLPTVRAFEAAMREGGKVKLDGKVYNLDSELSVKRV